MGVGQYYAKKRAYLAANPGGAYPGSTEDQNRTAYYTTSTDNEKLREENKELKAQVELMKKEFSKNPNPLEFEVVKTEVHGGYIIIEATYTGCTNFEGKKLMVFECSPLDLFKQRGMDPHFNDKEGYHSPIARFEPTVKGWILARKMCGS